MGSGYYPARKTSSLHGLHNVEEDEELKMASNLPDIPQPQKVRILVLLYLVVNKLAGHSWLMALYIG